MRKSKPRPTAERVRELFHYDPETGVFTHRETKRFQRSAPKYGQVGAGRISTFGYVVIKVDGVTYAAALLAWLYVHGKWPKGKIKYLNGNRADNKISNIFVHETPAGDIAGREMTQRGLKSFFTTSRKLDGLLGASITRLRRLASGLAATMDLVIGP